MESQVLQENRYYWINITGATGIEGATELQEFWYYRTYWKNRLTGANSGSTELTNRTV